MGFPGGSDSKESTCNAGDPGLIPGLGRSPEKGWASVFMGFSGGSDSKESTCNVRGPGFDLWVGKIPWRREMLPASVFWPREFHGQRSLAGYSPWGRKELDMSERLSLSV